MAQNQSETEPTAAPPSGGANPVPDGTITTAMAARLLLASSTWVRTLTRQGYIPKIGRDAYRVIDVIQGVVRYYQDDARRSSKSAAAARVQDARARAIELRNARQENLLIETEEALYCLDELFGIHKSECIGLAARITRDLELRRKIEAEIDGVFERTAKRLEEKAKALRENGSAAPSDPED